MNFKNIVQWLVIPAVAFMIFWLILPSHQTDELLNNKAFQSYLAGEKATTIATRKEEFNQALKLYLTLENKHQPEYGTGKLYYNIANSYYQLEEYAWAIWYYQRALALMLREEKVKNNLREAQEKLSFGRKEHNPLEKIFFFNYYFSLPERLQIFFMLSTTAIIFGSFYTWNQKKWLKQMTVSLVALVFLSSLSLAYTCYISPLQGVLIHAVDLRREAGMQYAKVGSQPLPGGQEVEVLGTVEDGKWVKVITQEGNFGYVPQEAIRLVIR